MNVLASKIKILEKQVLEQIEIKDEFQKSLQITGIGHILLSVVRVKIIVMPIIAVLSVLQALSHYMQE